MAQQSTRISQGATICQICKKPKRLNITVPAVFVHPPVVELIVKDHPHWSSDGFICLSDLNHYRGKHFDDLIHADKGELSAL